MAEWPGKGSRAAVASQWPARSERWLTAALEPTSERNCLTIGQKAGQALCLQRLGKCGCQAEGKELARMRGWVSEAQPGWDGGSPRGGHSALGKLGLWVNSKTY